MVGGGRPLIWHQSQSFLATATMRLTFYLIATITMQYEIYNNAH